MVLLFTGEVQDVVETNTLETPDKKRHKRPPASSRHVRRSASAEMVDREGYNRDAENVSPSRRRQRRKRVHGTGFYCYDRTFSCRPWGFMKVRKSTETGIV